MLIIFLGFFCFSDKKKLDDTPKTEKTTSKNGQDNEMEVESSEKDGTVVSDSDKAKENDENKDVKETTSDEKLRMCSLNILCAKQSF